VRVEEEAEAAYKNTSVLTNGE